MFLFNLIKRYRTEIAIVCTTIATFLVSSELELFERFHTFSRSHEDWELDEIAVLGLNILFASFWYLFHRSKELQLAVEERDLAEAEAQRMARHDSLTGLPNRRAYMSHLEDLARTKGSSTVVMMIDLDRFKAINDLHGHACGDFVLTETTQRLTEELEPDDFAARLGGDEFAIALAPGTSVEQAERLARRIGTTISAPYVYEGKKLSIGTSIGLASLAAGNAPSSALHSADQALYSAKKNGRGQFAWYDAELDKSAKERRILEQELREAVRNGSITAFFQPVVNISTNELCGFEALARWHHETRGMISPEVFIPIAEDTGLIAPLGWSILENACRAASHWDPSLKLAVNFSPTQFRDAFLVQTVKEVLDRTGFPPERLEIEVTESAIMLDFELARKSIEELRDLGVSLALDDFGTGFSSLSNLRKLPFDRIKIDRSFVSDIQDNPENQKIVTGILALAQGLRLSVTAEGIASNDDLSFLQGVDCPLGQGYLFAKPMDAEEIDWMLETKWAHMVSPQEVELEENTDSLPKAG